MLSLIYANLLNKFSTKSHQCGLQTETASNDETEPDVNRHDTKCTTLHRMQMNDQVQRSLTSRPTGSVCTISSRPGVVTSSHFSWCALGTVSVTRTTYIPWWRSPVYNASCYSAVILTLHPLECDIGLFHWLGNIIIIYMQLWIKFGSWTHILVTRIAYKSYSLDCMSCQPSSPSKALCNKTELIITKKNNSQDAEQKISCKPKGFDHQR